MNSFIKRGFTLIELLVVIAIIGLLASVVLTSLNSARIKGSVAAAQQTMKSMQAAGIICMNDQSAIDVDLSGTGDLVSTAGGVICTASTATFSKLPTGWILCDNAGVATDQSTTNCGNELSAQSPGISFSLVAERACATGALACEVIVCDVNQCLTTTETAN